MRKQKTSYFLFFIFTLLVFFPSPALSQLVLGQYEDEAPFRTWNTLGIKTASSLGMGEAQFTLASDCSVALSNPALLTKLPPISFTVSYSSKRAAFFKYSIVNTGVLYSDENLSHQYSGFDFIGMSLRLKNWALAASWSLLEAYYRPVSEFQYSSQGNIYYSIILDQRGELYNGNLSISGQLAKGFSIGLGFNYVYGQFNKDITEKWVRERITIADFKSQDYTGYYFNGGLVLDLSKSFRIGAMFQTPYIKKSKSQSSLRYESPGGVTDIEIEAASDDEYHQPLIVGLGVSYLISEGLKVMSDFTFYNWSKYKVIYFGEPQEREFKDVIKIAFGAEYVNAFLLFDQLFYAPWRVGFCYDPQPMKDPNSYYFYLSFGSGLRWKSLFFDAAFIMGQERGSGDSLTASKVAFTLSYQF